MARGPPSYGTWPSLIWQVGPEHIDTSGGYFQLGNVFYSMNKIENALAVYDKVRPLLLLLLLASPNPHRYPYSYSHSYSYSSSPAL
eukprot:2882174-Prymnesium_polylepis.1